MDTAGRPMGSLVCVGLGMMLGAHLSPRARQLIMSADSVYVAASDGLVELWVREMRPDAHSLQPYYGHDKSRRVTYREMADALLANVRAGHRVCAAFYGHPGVFAQVAHDAIATARSEGFTASMEAGISAEDCLYADLGIDPGRTGCQHFEATQFLLYRRRVDPAACLVLWQVAHVGDATCTRAATDAAHRELLVERLREDYPPDHEVIVYEAPTVALSAPRIEKMPLGSFVDAALKNHSTLVVPAAVPLVPDREMRRRLAALQHPVRRRRAHLSLVTNQTELAQ